MKYFIIGLLIILFSGCKTNEKNKHINQIAKINPGKVYFSILKNLNPEQPLSEEAQNTNSLNGKVLRINIDGMDTNYCSGRN